MPTHAIDTVYDKDWLTSRETFNILRISKRTLSNWTKKGRIRKYHISRSKCLYNAQDIMGIIGKKWEKNQWAVVYARVQDVGKVDDLNEQVLRVTEFCTKNGVAVDKVYKDVCTSTTFERLKRRGFHEMLLDVIDRRVDVIFVESPDRLSLFGYEMFTTICKYFRTKIVYLSENPINQRYKDETAREMKAAVEGLRDTYYGEQNANLGRGPR